MFGFSLTATRYLEMLEKELRYYRDKAEQEQRRADRLHDEILVMNGREPATEIVRDERQLDTSKINAQLQEQRQQLVEMFAESLDEFEQEGLELPEELQQEADAMIRGAMQPGNSALALFKKKEKEKEKENHRGEKDTRVSG